MLKQCCPRLKLQDLTAAAFCLINKLLKCSNASGEAFVLSAFGRLGASKKERRRELFVEEQQCKGERSLEQAPVADGTVCTRGLRCTARAHSGGNSLKRDSDHRSGPLDYQHRGHSDTQVVTGFENNPADTSALVAFSCKR